MFFFLELSGVPNAAPRLQHGERKRTEAAGWQNSYTKFPCRCKEGENKYSNLILVFILWEIGGNEHRWCIFDSAQYPLQYICGKTGFDSPLVYDQVPAVVCFSARRNGV
jgi:hypothetical protein